MQQDFSHLPPPVIEIVSEEEVFISRIGNPDDYVCPVCNLELCWYDPLDMWACPVCDTSSDSDTNPEMCGDLGGNE